MQVEVWRGEGGAYARSEFRHVYITAQDISQSQAQAARVPRLRSHRVLKRGTSFSLFSSSLPPPAPSVAVGPVQEFRPICISAQLCSLLSPEILMHFKCNIQQLAN